LEILTVLYDVDEVESEERLQKVLSGLPVTASIPEYINAAYSMDDRLK
jgi:hypothetical protein